MLSVDSARIAPTIAETPAVVAAEPPKNPHIFVRAWADVCDFARVSPGKTVGYTLVTGIGYGAMLAKAPGLTLTVSCMVVGLLGALGLMEQGLKPKAVPVPAETSTIKTHEGF